MKHTSFHLPAKNISVCKINCLSIFLVAVRPVNKLTRPLRKLACLMSKLTNPKSKLARHVSKAVIALCKLVISILRFIVSVLKTLSYELMKGWIFKIFLGEKCMLQILIT